VHISTLLTGSLGHPVSQGEKCSLLVTKILIYWILSCVMNYYVFSDILGLTQSPDLKPFEQVLQSLDQCVHTFHFSL